MPVVTNDEEASGFIGFEVVWAWRKAVMPAALNAPPTSAMATATAMRKGKATSKVSVSRETAHIVKARTNATTGGGTFSSSAFMGFQLLDCIAGYCAGSVEDADFGLCSSIAVW